MPLAIEISVPSFDAIDFRGLERALAPARVSAVAGRAAVNTSRKHLLELNRTRANRLGGQRTNFYQKAANSVSTRSEGDAFIMTFASVGLAQRYFGGTIRAKNVKFLTIPARAEAYGKRASEFNDLSFQFTSNGPALVRRAQTTIKFRKGPDGQRRAVRSGTKGGEIGATAGGEVMFWLKREVTQDPDPSVLPTDETLGDQVDKAVGDFAQLQIDRATGGGASA